MEINLEDAVAYLSLGLILYYIISEVMKQREGAARWLAWAIIVIIFGLIAWFFWSNYQKSQNVKKTKQGEAGEPSEGDIDSHEDEQSESEEQKQVYVQDNYHVQKRQFTLLDEPLGENQNTIRYADFKQWYLSPEFLLQYQNAVRQAFRIKKKRLHDALKRCAEDIKALKIKKPKDGLNGLLQSLDRTEDSKMLESTMSEIESLIKEIETREKIVTIEWVRQSLISALTHPENGIDSLMGREDVKDFLALQLFTFAQNPRIFFSNFQNIAVYGPSGVGKTKLAKVVGHVYASSGILLRNHVHTVTKQSFTTAYVNESGRLTRKLLLANLEAVVFIDEAYDMIAPPTVFGKGIDHGVEAVAEMVNFMDKMMGLSIIIVAGYEKEMETRFMSSNEGLPRRFPHKLVLQPYGPKALTNILIKFLLETCPDIRFNEQYGDYLYTIIKYIDEHNPEVFKNQAGDMANLSGFIARAIYGTPGKMWPKNAEELMFIGINGYLGRKGIAIEQIK